MRFGLFADRGKLVLSVAVVGVAMACGGGQDSTTEPYSDPDPEPDPDPESGITEIRLTANLSFSPPSVTLSAGDTVRWVNAENIDHTITPREMDQDGVWNRQVMSEAEQTFMHVFEVAGQEYDYFCEPHEADGMTGTITVE